MLPAIHLNNELRAVAAEIRHIGADRNLSAEMRILNRKAIPQMPPQPFFRFGERAPQKLRIHGHASRHRL